MHKQLKIFLISNSFFILATGFATLIGAFLVKIFGFRTMFLIMFIVSLFGLMAIIDIEDKNEPKRIY